MVLRHKRRAGCEWTSQKREEKALALLKREAPRIRGDFFAATIEEAISAVEKACSDIKAVSSQ